MVEIIMLREDRFLAVAWKNGSVHYMGLMTNEAIAQKIAQESLTHKPVAEEVYINLEKLVKKL